MFNDLPFTLTTAFDPLTLIEYPLHPLQVEGALFYVQARLDYLDLPAEQQVSYLTQYALLLRLKPSYPESITAFLEALAMWQDTRLRDHPQQLRQWIANRIRLADTYRLQADFMRSNRAFSDLLAESVQWDEPLKRDYQHFLWQHIGKNAFAQSDFAEAKVHFKKALQFRQQEQLPQDLIDSSQLALSRCSQ